MAEDLVLTSMDGWSEIVPSQEAAGVGEGRGAGADGLAAQSGGGGAQAVVVAVVLRAGLVLTDKGFSRAAGRAERSAAPHQAAGAGPSPGKPAPRTG